jgi:hypothetical protein
VDWAKFKSGVVVAFDTPVVKSGDSPPALKEVTVPVPPLDEPVKLHVVPEHEPAPLAKLKVNAPAVEFILDTASPAATNADEGWNAAVPNAPPFAVVSADAVTNVAFVVAVKFAAVVAVAALPVVG